MGVRRRAVGVGGVRGVVGVGARVRAAAAVAGELVAVRERGGGVRGGLAVREGDRGGGGSPPAAALPRLLLPLQLQLRAWGIPGGAPPAPPAPLRRRAAQLVELAQVQPEPGCCQSKPPSSKNGMRCTSSRCRSSPAAAGPSALVRHRQQVGSVSGSTPRYAREDGAGVARHICATQLRLWATTANAGGFLCGRATILSSTHLVSH